MTTGERIELLIKELKLKKVEFAAMVEIDQSYVTKIIKGVGKVSPRLLETISQKFGVRREWLETGNGEMYKDVDSAMIDRLEKQYRLTAQSREFIENFLKLPSDVRDLLARAIKQLAKEYPRKPDSALTAEEKRAIMNAELDAEAAAEKREQTSSVSIISSGLSKKLNKHSR
ncbi:MAG: helix-turn-helix domain-containing protein [Selenomonadaceae bacterium]|nr:helix-turn-helix domain-containing protein [Selenomonadaceae bacterium]